MNSPVALIKGGDMKYWWLPLLIAGLLIIGYAYQMDKGISPTRFKESYKTFSIQGPEGKASGVYVKEEAGYKYYHLQTEDGRRWIYLISGNDGYKIEATEQWEPWPGANPQPIRIDERKDLDVFHHKDGRKTVRER